MEVAGEVGYGCDPHKVRFGCRECGSKSGKPKVVLLEVDVDRVPRVGVWRPMKMGRNQPTAWMLGRLR
jgi:hypothetical protein